MKVEFIFHWVGHLCIQEGGQTQPIPGVHSLDAKAVLVFARTVYGEGGRRKMKWGEEEEEEEEEKGEEDEAQAEEGSIRRL